MVVIDASEANKIASMNVIDVRLDNMANEMLNEVMILINTEATAGNKELSVDYEKIIPLDKFRVIFHKEINEHIIKDTKHDIMDHCDDSGIIDILECKLKDLGYSAKTERYTATVDVPLTSIQYIVNYRKLNLKW